MSDEKVCFAQVDGHLDTNPKIRKAGSVFATAIFEFLLRRVAIAHSNGTVPVRYLDPDYLADLLMMTCDEARHGTSRAIAAELIRVDEALGIVYIVGWSPEWGRRPKAGAERTASWRERKRAETGEHGHVTVTNGDAARRGVTLGDESDGSEEKRREEIRERSAEPDHASQIAEAAVGEINRLRGTSYQADSAATIKDCRTLAKEKYTPEQAVRVVQSKRPWLDDARMREHFKPKTLLRPSNFRNYWDDIAAGTQRNGARRLAPPVSDEPDLSTSLGAK